MNDLATELSNHFIFQTLPQPAIQKLISLGRRQSVQKGSFLCFQEDHWPYMVYVIKGELRWALISISGREHVLYYVEPKQTFWAHTMWDDKPVPASLSASKHSEIITWHRDALHPFLSQYPETLWGIIRYQSKIMRKAREIIYGLAFQPVASRLAKLLLERSGSAVDEPIKRDITLNEIATVINSTQEVVCRVLYQFQEDGLLRMNRANIQLQDIPALQKLIETD